MHARRAHAAEPHTNRRVWPLNASGTVPPTGVRQGGGARLATESRVALVVTDGVLVCDMHAVGRSAGGVQQLLQRGAFALEALKLLQVLSCSYGNSSQQLNGVDVS